MQSYLDLDQGIESAFCVVLPLALALFFFFLFIPFVVGSFFLFYVY
jgi:hypothetical protein